MPALVFKCTFLYTLTKNPTICTENLRIVADKSVNYQKNKNLDISK